MPERLTGSGDARLIPALDGLPQPWLDGAEISFDLVHRGRVGVSFFFTEPFAFRAFCDRAQVPAEVGRNEATLRETFALVPRHWVKRHFVAGHPAGFSQYFTVHPRIVYPITTLRLFLRRYGCPDVGAVEAMLEPALAREDSQWFLILKHGEAPHPRIACRMARSLIPEILDRLVAAGFLDEVRARAYGRWDQCIQASAFVYVSIDPGRWGACSIDFEAVAPASLPAGWEELHRQLAVPFHPRYLKCRIPDGAVLPEWTVYLPLASWLPLLRPGDGGPRRASS